MYNYIIQLSEFTSEKYTSAYDNEHTESILSNIRVFILYIYIYIYIYL